jgi:gag-polypeptide of LTR copia-type/Zinc knuckle
MYLHPTITMAKSGFNKLNDANYHIWKDYMELLLVDKGDLYTLMDSTEITPLTGPNSKAMIAFKKKQWLAHATIHLNVEPNQLVHCKSNDPKEIWEELATVHNAQGLASLMSLRCTFHTMTKEDNVPMWTWITSVHDIVSHITELGSDVATKDIILTLTCGLPATYKSLVIALDSMDHSTLTINYVVQQLLNEEEWQISNTIPSNGSTSAYIAHACSTLAPHTTPATLVCYNCKQTGHLKNDCLISTHEAHAMWRKKEEGSANVAETVNIASEGVDDYIEMFW